MKILFVGNGVLRSDQYPIPDIGGSVQTWGLSKALAERKNDVYIVRRGNEQNQKVQGVTLISIPFKGIENIMPSYSAPFFMSVVASKIHFSGKSLKKIIGVDPDIICLTDRFTGIFPATLALPKVYIMHVPEILDCFKPYDIRANKLNALLFYVKKRTETSVMKRADKVVVLNTFMKNYLETKGFTNLVKIPNAVDTQQFTDNGDKNYVLYAGRFDWNKNVCSLVEAFSEIREYCNDFHLYLVGEGPQESEIRRLISKKALQSQVTIIPWLQRKELSIMMSNCSVLVLPSSFETFGLVVLEAMASGKPVIAKNNIGTSDIVIHNITGCLYDNAEELRMYLKLLLADKDLRKRMGCNARKIIEQRYTFAKLAERYEELFRCAVKEFDGKNRSFQSVGDYQRNEKKS